MKDVEEVLKEKTQSYQCGERTVEITEYNFDDQDDMIGTNKQEEEEEDNSEHVVRVMLYDFGWGNGVGNINWSPSLDFFHTLKSTGGSINQFWHLLLMMYM